MKSVLVTEAAGDVGTRLRKLLKGVYPRLRASDVKRAIRADRSAVTNMMNGCGKFPTLARDFYD